MFGFVLIYVYKFMHVYMYMYTCVYIYKYVFQENHNMEVRAYISQLGHVQVDRIQGICKQLYAWIIRCILHMYITYARSYIYIHTSVLRFPMSRVSFENVQASMWMHLFLLCMCARSYMYTCNNWRHIHDIPKTVLVTSQQAPRRPAQYCVALFAGEAPFVLYIYFEPTRFLI